jgi:hypothetical protein
MLRSLGIPFRTLRPSGYQNARRTLGFICRNTRRVPWGVAVLPFSECDQGKRIRPSEPEQAFLSIPLLPHLQATRSVCPDLSRIKTHCGSLLEHSSLEWGTPVLYLRSTDGLLFDIAERVPAAGEQMEQHPIPAIRPAEARFSAPSSGETDQVKPMQVATPEPEKGGAAVPSPGRGNLTMIDLGIEAARKLRADRHSVSVTDLHTVYLRDNPGIEKGRTIDSFSTTIAYHTINMHSRFPDPAHKQKLTLWLSRPVFKRVAYGQYMLLSPEELALFRRLVEVGDPRIYEDEYLGAVAGIARHPGQRAGPGPGGRPGSAGASGDGRDAWSWPLWTRAILETSHWKQQRRAFAWKW